MGPIRAVLRQRARKRTGPSAAGARTSLADTVTLRDAQRRTASKEMVGMKDDPPKPHEPSGIDAVSTIIAVLERGPLGGQRVAADLVQARPPKTIDVRAEDGSMCRYGLADWVQTGPSAVYTFLYRV